MWELLINCKRLCRVSAGCQTLKTLTLPFSSLPQGSRVEPRARGAVEALLGEGKQRTQRGCPGAPACFRGSGLGEEKWCWKEQSVLLWASWTVNKEKYHRKVWKGGFTLTLLHTHTHTHTAHQPGMWSLLDQPRHRLLLAPWEGR